MEKVIVLGSNSFSGSHLVDLLLEKTDYEIIGISRSPEKKQIFLPYKKKKTTRFKFFQMDLNKHLRKIFEVLDKEQPNLIVNFAAQSEVGPSWENPAHWFHTNCLGIVNFTNELKKRSYITKYIHISSPEVYGTCEGLVTESAPFNPSTPYAASKAAGDMFIQVLVKNSNFPAILIRSTNVYGPGQQLFKIIPRSIIYIKKGIRIQLHGGGKAIKSYIHIRDVCVGILKTIKMGNIGDIYHLSPEKGYSIENVVKLICNRMSVNFEEVAEPVGERLGQDAKYVIDSNKARKELNWKPRIQFTDGLDQVIKWVNENWEEIQKLPVLYQHKE